MDRELALKMLHDWWHKTKIWCEYDNDNKEVHERLRQDKMKIEEDILSAMGVK